MLRLSLLLLLVSLVLAIAQSTDDRVNRRNDAKPDSALTYSYQQRRRQQQPRVEIKEENAGRYFRRRPQTTTVSSIFSMKVENESQHVYPNMNWLDNLHVQPKQEEINMTDISTSTQQPTFSPITNSNNRRLNNVHRRIPHYVHIRRPSCARTPEQVLQQAEKITEQLVTSTTFAPIIDITVKEQEKVVLPTYDSNFSNEVSSLERPHPTISQIPEAFIQRMKETAEEVDISTSYPPVVISTTEKEPEIRVFTPSAAYVSDLMSFVQRRHPIFVKKPELPVIHQRETNEQSIYSPATALLPLVSNVRPKSRRVLNRGSHKYNMNNFKKDKSKVQVSDIGSNLSQLTSTTPVTPPPVPTLSPWYDGFGK